MCNMGVIIVPLSKDCHMNQMNEDIESSSRPHVNVRWCDYSFIHQMMNDHVLEVPALWGVG